MTLTQIKSLEHFNNHDNTDVNHDFLAEKNILKENRLLEYLFSLNFRDTDTYKSRENCNLLLKQKVVKGISNLKKPCFMNSVLHVLYNIDDLIYNITR